jgi:hypothetical protein
MSILGILLLFICCSTQIDGVLNVSIITTVKIGGNSKSCNT